MITKLNSLLSFFLEIQILLQKVVDFVILVNLKIKELKEGRELHMYQRLENLLFKLTTE